jgi:hypothetical protein
MKLQGIKTNNGFLQFPNPADICVGVRTHTHRSSPTNRGTLRYRFLHEPKNYDFLLCFVSLRALYFKSYRIWLDTTMADTDGFRSDLHIAMRQDGAILTGQVGFMSDGTLWNLLTS